MRAALRLDEGALEGFLVLGREKKKKGKNKNKKTLLLSLLNSPLSCHPFELVIVARLLGSTKGGVIIHVGDMTCFT